MTLNNVILFLKRAENTTFISLSFLYYYIASNNTLSNVPRTLSLRYVEISCLLKKLICIVVSFMPAIPKRDVNFARHVKGAIVSHMCDDGDRVEHKPCFLELYFDALPPEYNIESWLRTFQLLQLLRSRLCVHIYKFLTHSTSDHISIWIGQTSCLTHYRWHFDKNNSNWIRPHLI